MPKTKLLVFAAFAVFVLTAPATAIAGTGGQWLVNGKPLLAGESAELLPKALALRFQEAEFKILAANFGLKCESPTVEIEGGKIIGSDGLLAKKLTFHQCLAIGIATCDLESESISTVPVHGLASLDLPGSLNAYILVLPETKTVFATIKFLGESCAIAGIQTITGDLSFLVHGALHEALSHLALAITLKGAFRIGSDEIDANKIAFDIALASHQNWSFR